MLRPPLRSPLRPSLRSPLRGFIPADLGSDLIAHWSADDTGLITLSTANVTSWKDRVSGLDLAQSTDAARPVWSATSFNGNPGVTFDGTDDVLSAASVGNLPTGSSPAEIWAVVDQAALVADTTTRIIFAYGGTSGNTSRAIRRTVVSSQNRASVITGTGAATGSAALAADFSGRHAVGGIFTASGVTAIMDGVATAETAVVSGTTTTRTVMGASTSLGASFLNGVVRDILVTRPTGAAKRHLLTSWLASRRAA